MDINEVIYTSGQTAYLRAMQATARTPAVLYLRSLYASYLLADSTYVLSKCHLSAGFLENGAERKIYARVEKDFGDGRVHKCVLPIFNSWEAKMWYYLIDFRYGRGMAPVKISVLQYKMLASFVEEVKVKLAGSPALLEMLQRGMRRDKANSYAYFLTRLRFYYLLHERNQPEEILRRLVGNKRLGWFFSKGILDSTKLIPAETYVLGNVFDSMNKNALLNSITTV